MPHPFGGWGFVASKPSGPERNAGRTHAPGVRKDPTGHTV